MALAAVILCVDLGRGWLPPPDPVVRLSAPFEGRWFVLQGGRSPMQNQHLIAYNQHFALDLVHLDASGSLFVAGREGNARTSAWEQPLYAPVAGRVVVARDTVEDSGGPNRVSESEAAAGNEVVIETQDGHFVLLAHLRHGSVSVEVGDEVAVGRPIARVGNSGNTDLPHLHLQVQTHPGMWDPANRSVPFAFGENGRVLSRNDVVTGL